MAASKTSIMVLAVMMTAGLFQCASAVTHTVTWIGTENATQYDDWASKETFLVGDEIAFLYGAAHNVFEVSKADLDACNLNNPMMKYESPNAVVALPRSGYFGFICGVPGHCSGGHMKMNVQVLAAPTNSSSPPSASPVSCPTPAVRSPAAAPAPSDAPSLQSRPAMVVGALVAACAAVLL